MDKGDIFMAGTLTHNKFGHDLLKKLNNIELDKDFFIIGNQGHDLLYFIKLWEYPYRSKYVKEVKELQKIDIQEFAQYLKTDNGQLKSFLYGYLAHEILDHYVHPFINKECNFDEDKHALLESKIDYLLNDMTNLDIPRKLKFTTEMAAELNTIFTNYFHSAKYSQRMLKTVNYVYPFLKRYRLDKYGLKKLGYQLINASKFRFLAYHYRPEELTLDLTPFLNLYNEALEEATKFINSLENRH